MKKIFILLSLLTNFCAFGQSSVLIEPNGSNGILSKNATTVFSAPASVTLPATGGGTRLIWIPAKSAFRVGTVSGTQWDDSNIGTWSFSSGSNTTASGLRSTSLGTGTIASGFVSTSMGNGTNASGENSISMGVGTIASGGSSTSMGGFTTASGNNSTSMGDNTTAQARSSVAMGYYNVIAGSTNTDVATDPLMVVGNGTSLTRSNALTLLKNSNLGLNTTTPQYQLSFKDDLGDKISLYYGNTSNTTNHYGMGIQSAKFQLFTPSDQDDLVFGYGRSAAFTENVRFKGNGNIGIGTSTPNAPLQFASTIANRKIVMYEFSNNDHQYVGFGVNGNALRYQVDVPNGSHVFYAANNAASSTELMRVNSNGLGIGINNPAEKLHVIGNIRSSSLEGTGVRNVYSDANGSLTTNPQTKYLSIHPTKFKPSNGSNYAKVNYLYDKMGFTSNTDGSLYASVELPHGAQVTSIKFYYIDNSVTYDLYFRLFRVELSSMNGSANIICEFQSPLPNSPNYRSGIVNLSSPLIVDNQNYSYFIAIDTPTQSSNLNGLWQVNTMFASSVVITYNQ